MLLQAQSIGPEGLNVFVQAKSCTEELAQLIRPVNIPLITVICRQVVERMSQRHMDRVSREKSLRKIWRRQIDRWRRRMRRLKTQCGLGHRE